MIVSKGVLELEESCTILHLTFGLSNFCISLREAKFQRPTHLWPSVLLNLLCQSWDTLTFPQDSVPSVVELVTLP